MKTIILCLCVFLSVCNASKRREVCLMCIDAVNALDVALLAKGNVKKAAQYFCEQKVKESRVKDCKNLIKHHLKDIVRQLKEPLRNDGAMICNNIHVCGPHHDAEDYAPPKENKHQTSHIDY
ncbi:hypothetical protein Aduo_000419 [Ancylostoma duodenale]